MQWVIFAVVLGTALIPDITRQRQREKRIKQIAHAYGFAFPGRSLPKSFPFDRTSVRRAAEIRNANCG